MKPTTLILAAALLPWAALDAHAVTQTYSRATATDRQGLLADDFDVEPGAPSSAMAAVGAVTASASADFGVIKLAADAPQLGGQFTQAQATASFSDTLNFSVPGPDPVPYTLGFVADGFVTNRLPGVGEWSYSVQMSLNGRFNADGKTLTMTTSDTGAVSINLSFSGFVVPDAGPLELFVYFTIATNGNEFGAFDLDFSHTGVLAGFDVPGGTTVTSEAAGVLPSFGGAFTYPAAVAELQSPVPEPAAPLLAAAGLALLALVRRRAGSGARAARLLPVPSPSAF